MELLPPVEEREALLDALRDLVADGGATGFLVAPIVEPTDRFFPDRFDADRASFARLVRRLLRDVLFEDARVELVELEDLDVESIPGPRGCGGGSCGKPQCAEKKGESGSGPRSAESGSGPLSPEGERAGVREDVVHEAPTGFVGIGDGVFRFVAPAIDVRQKEHLVAWTAREVARAYRAHRNLLHDDAGSPAGSAATEEKLVDVTAVFLGLGVLMANEALRRHAESHIEGRMVRTTRWETQIGVLSPTSLCWLLAAQVTARGRDEADRIAPLLHSEPRDSFRRAMDEMARSDVRTRVGLPARDPEQPSGAELETWMLERMEEDEAALPASPRAAATRNAGRRVFRVLVRRTWAGAALGALVGIVFTAYAIRGSVALTYLVPLLGTIVGAWLGRTQRSFLCSDPQCLARLEPSLAQCPSCGGDVSGEIARAADRLAAEEELERRTGGYRDPG